MSRITRAELAEIQQNMYLHAQLVRTAKSRGIDLDVLMEAACAFVEQREQARNAALEKVAADKRLADAMRSERPQSFHDDTTPVPGLVADAILEAEAKTVKKRGFFS